MVATAQVAAVCHAAQERPDLTVAHVLLPMLCRPAQLVRVTFVLFLLHIFHDASKTFIRLCSLGTNSYIYASLSRIF
jgi:hypothetical protein